MLTKVLTGKYTFTSLKPPDLSSCTKQYLKDYFENGYDIEESLFSSLKDDSVFFTSPNRLRQMLIFYFTHSAAVFINKLVLCGMTDDRVDLKMETLFEIGVDEMTWDDTTNDHLGKSIEWPTLDECIDYRCKVRAFILNLIEITSLTLPITQTSPWWGVLMGMEHQRVHFDTSTMLLRQLPVTYLHKPDIWDYAPLSACTPVTANPMIQVEGQEVTFGKPQDFPSYGWDIEYGQKTCFVPSFEASTYLVTNHEFLAFVEDDGYEREELWTKEGWEWRCYMGAMHPTFWICHRECRSVGGGQLTNHSHCSHIPGAGSHNDPTSNPSTSQYSFRALFDVIDMPWDWPVEVNYHEVSAFCRWKGSDFRPVIEAETHLMMDPVALCDRSTDNDVSYQRGVANTGLVFASPSPVSMYSPTSRGFYDIHGNVWTWVADHMNGLPGFRPHYLYDDFTTPFIDGCHIMILGGSWAVSGVFGSRFTRPWFRKHFQFCGFRLARSLPQNDVAADGTNDGRVKLPVCVVNSRVYVLHHGFIENPVEWDASRYIVETEPATNRQFKYDSDQALRKQLHRDYLCDGTRTEMWVQLALGHQPHPVTDEYCMAMHIGCGTGSVVFELSKHFDKVLGVDFSGRFIDAAMQLQTKGRYTLTDKHKLVTVELDNDVITKNVTFKQFVNLPNEVNGHCVVLVTSLDRMITPKAVLVRLWEIVTKNGVLIITSKKWDAAAIKAVVTHRLELIKILPHHHGEAVTTLWRRKSWNTSPHALA